MDLIWLFVLLPFVALVFLPKKLFNIFAVPQVFALGSLSLLGITIGMVNGIFPVTMPVLLSTMFLITMTASFMWTDPVHNARKEYGQQAPFFLLFMLGCAYMNYDNIHLVLLAFTVVTFIECLYSYGQTKGIDWFFSNKIKGGGPKTNAIGTIGNPNFLASFLAISFWLTIAACVTVSWYIAPVSAFCLFMLYKTRSRAGLVSMVASTFFLVWVAAFFGWFPFPGILGQDINWIISRTCMVLFGVGLLTIPVVMYKNWDTFWKKPIEDPNGPQIWYLTLRYRFCYWWAAWVLIKQKPLLGWGMWSYRKEVYAAQAKIHHEKYDKFLDFNRYLTPQPRECHNDYIEYIVEYGIVGFLIIMAFIISVFVAGFSFLSVAEGIPFMLMAVLMAGLVAVLVDAFFFFALRLVPTSIAFWSLCAMIVGMSSISIVHVAVPLMVVVFVTAITAGALYTCSFKRLMASYWFNISKINPDINKRSHALQKALNYAPNDTILRTHACLGVLDHEPGLANFHAVKMLDDFDGMVPLWSCLFNVALAKARTKNLFEEATMLLNNAFYVHPYWPPTRDMLFSPDGIGSRSRYIGGPRNMVTASEEMKFHAKSLMTTNENIQLKMQLINEEIDKLQVKSKRDMNNNKKEIVELNIQLLKSKLEGLQKDMQISIANINIVCLSEKKRLNIPDNWIYHGDANQFVDPAEAQRRGLLNERMPIDNKGKDEDPYAGYSLEKQREAALNPETK